MSVLRIADLETASSVSGDEFIVLDNAVITRKATVDTVTKTVITTLTATTVLNLSSSVMPAVSAGLVSAFLPTLEPLSANINTQFNELSTNNNLLFNTLSSNSVLQFNTLSADNNTHFNELSTNIETQFVTLSTDIETQFNTLQSNINVLSSFWAGYLNITNITTNYNILPTDIGGTIAYTGTQNITAFIDNSININGFTTTIAQLSSGTITIVLADDFLKLISYANLYTTAGEGAVASIIRTSNNTFLATGLLQ